LPWDLCYEKIATNLIFFKNPQALLTIKDEMIDEKEGYEFRKLCFLLVYRL